MDAKETRDLKATLEKRENKSGKPYYCVLVKLTDTYEKMVFLEKAEEELIKLSQPTIKSPFGK